MKAVFTLAALFGVFQIAASVAMAHPQDDQPLTIVEAGASITALRDINITSQGLHVSNGFAQPAYIRDEVGVAKCFIYTDMNTDVVIPKGTTLLLVETQDRNRKVLIGSKFETNMPIFKTPSNHALRMQCTAKVDSTDPYSLRTRGISIGEFQNVFKGVFSLKEKNPTIL